MKFALAQINPIIGDFEYNSDKILSFVKKANEDGADIVIFHELALCGYPPKDLLLKKQFIEDNKKCLDLLAKKIKEINSEIGVVIGFAEENKGEGRPLFNSLALVSNGEVITTRQKTLLPTYDVFDEDRYFEKAKEIKEVTFKGKKIGLTICEDIWLESDEWTKPRYHTAPLEELSKNNLDFIINASASPFFVGKPKLREDILKKTAIKYKTPIIYVNQVGANDELIFDGNSSVVNKNGDLCLKLKSFEEDLQIIDLMTVNNKSQTTEYVHGSNREEKEILEALKLGIKDYVKKCGFKKVLIGLSGGIDSALVATLATFALGKENVICVSMPSRYTSNASNDDAKELSDNLGIELKTIPIEDPFKSFIKILDPVISNGNGNSLNSLTEENLQPRIRGLILMALSNQLGALVLSTGNKSELATGYCTLYGDMCGGLSVISDLPKTLVYKLSNYINEKNTIIPENIISKAPTAELKPNQKDEDTLPKYSELDQILNYYVEDHLPLKEIVKIGTSKETIKKVCNMIDTNEYKRKQAAPGLKLTNRSFGYGWRMPIAQGYKENL